MQIKREPDVFEKKSVPAVIQTVTQRICGNIHVREWERVKDMLDNATERYIAVTDAKVFNFKGEVIHECPFMAISMEHIVWINPQDIESGCD